MPDRPASSGWLSRLGLDRPELRAWAMHDWANSAFWTTVIGVVFPMYFVRTAGANLEPSSATSRLALASAVAIGIVAVVSPVLGAIADYAALKKRLLRPIGSTSGVRVDMTPVLGRPGARNRMP